MNDLNAINSLSIQKFDYSQLDNNTAEFLKQKAFKIGQIVDDTRYQLGREFSEAQARLAHHYNGTFTKWYESLGFKHDDVYFWINEFKFYKKLDNPKWISNFNKMPKTLKRDILMKKTSEEERRAVLDGKIKSHKEFIKSQKKTVLSAAQDSNEKRIEMIDKQLDEIQLLINQTRMLLNHHDHSTAPKED